MKGTQSMSEVTARGTRETKAARFRRGRRAVWSVALVSAAALTLAACSSSSSSGGGGDSTGSSSGSATASAATKSGGSLNVALVNDILSMNPTQDNELAGINVFYQLFDQLTEVQANGTIGPRLATSWTSNANATQWTYKLRTDAKFSNGQPVTADDVLYSWQVVKDDKKSLNNVYTTDIKSMKKISASEIQFNLITPFASWPSETTLLSIVPENYYKQVGPDGFAKKPIGSGPFTFVSYTPGQSIVLKKNPDYWGTKATIDNLTFQVVADDTARVNGAQSGQLDIAQIPDTQVKVVKAAGSTNVETTPGNMVVYLGMNQANKWLANVNIRKAIDMAVDRKTMTSNLLGGLTTPVGQLVTASTSGYAKSVQPTPFNLAQAKQLISQSGYDGTPIPFEYATNGRIQQSAEVAQAVAGYLQDAGLKIKLQGTDYNTFNSDSTDKKFTGIYLNALNPSVMDASIAEQYVIGPQAAKYFVDKTLDAMVTKAMATTPISAENAVLAQIWQHIQATAEFAPLYSNTYSFAVAKKVSWQPRPDGMYFATTMHLTS
jgi:peptide/nickel transport system substrate-binding protein